MRCDQLMGLPQIAIDFLAENEIPLEICKCCHRPLPLKTRLVGYFEGMFDTKYPLNQHQLKDGRVANEYLQTSPWSSGPCLFLGLQILDSQGNVVDDLQWTENEIAESI